MRFNNFRYLVKEGIRGIFLHGFMSFAAVIVTLACLLIVGSFYSVVYNLNVLVDDLNKTNEVVAYVDIDLPDAEARSVGTWINQVDNVQRAKFVSKEEALEAFLKQHEGDEAFTGIEAEDLRHRYVITLIDNALMKETVAELEQIEGVVKIQASFELAEGFSTVKDVLQWVSLGVIAILLGVSLLIISNTVKMAMYDRKDEIAIMKMVGATNGFIRLPFVVEGFILGMVSAGAAFILEWMLYDAVVLRIEAMDSLQLFEFVPFTDLLIPMAVVFGGAGMLVGIVGSWTSIRKFMDV